MDLCAKSMANFLLKQSINPGGWLHGATQPFQILQFLSTNQRTDRHDSTRKGPTSFSSQGYSSGKRTPCFEDLTASNIQLFLQRCKNGLCSPMEIHLVLKRQFEYLIKQFIFFPHRSSLSKKIFTPFLSLFITKFKSKRHYQVSHCPISLALSKAPDGELAEWDSLVMLGNQRTRGKGAQNSM